MYYMILYILTIYNTTINYILYNIFYYILTVYYYILYREKP